MPDITITQRPEHGPGRGDAVDTDGRVLGWIDVQTGEVSVIAANRADVAEALYLWRANQLSEARDLLDGAPTWRDLAEHRPGELVSARASNEWEAARGRHPLMAILVRALGIHTEEAAWRKGSKGEQRTGKLLARLESRGWRTLHSIPRGDVDADIDHLVVGPGGVFTINTKMHPNARVWVGRWTVKVNGQKRTEYLSKARREARYASGRLSRTVGWPVDVFPTVVILCESMKVAQMPHDVSVMRGLHLVDWLRSQTAVLTPGQIEAIYQVARRSDTWS